tara:strand:- start:9114 stop:9788 length:675 start_codon:yes stop_codon:yes gene_type:complete
MGSTTANTGGGSYGGGERDKEQLKKNITKVALVKAADTEKKKQIAAGNQMFGGAVSQAVNEEMVNQKLAKVGSYFIQDGGNFIRTDEKGYLSAQAAGKKVSKSYITNSAGKEMKYGKSNSAMGSGDNSGAMTSTAISSKMLQSQNKFKGLVLGGLSLAAGGVPATLMRLDATKSLKDAATPNKAFKEYKTQFSAKMSGKKPPKKSTLLSDTIGGINKLKLSLGE